MSEKEDLRKRLRDKIKKKENNRCSKENKKIIDDNLKSLGVNNIDSLKNIVNQTKNMDSTQLKKALASLGITQKQLNDFYKIIEKK